MPIFLKYGNIRGEAKEPAHRSWMELESASFSPHGSRAISEISVSRRSDSASIHLQQQAIGGAQVSAIIDFVRAQGGVYLRLELSGTMISSYSLSSDGDRPTEALTLNFSKMEYKPIPGTPAP